MKSDLPQTQIQFIPFRGGFDDETPPLSVPYGFARNAQNYECDINGGYSTIVGYERFDGRTAPSDASYATLGVTITGSIAVGATVTGVTSAATGVVVANVTTYLVITKITGTFQSGEVLNVSGSPQATTTTAAVTDGGSTAELHAIYKNLAADNYRSDIAVPTGSGSILGGFYYNDACYCFRNNAGGTAANLWKQSTSGWTQITFGEEISFTNANTSVEDADTLTQGGVTATIARVVVETGTLVSGTNTGRLIITGRAGGNFAAGAASSTGGGSLTLDGAETAITLLPDGKFRTDIYNFGGGSGTLKVYGCDGVNRGWEFDGTTFVPIETGMTTDTPDFVRGHKLHLFFSFGSSVQHSSIGFPYMWSPVTGAGEIGMGEDVTGLIPVQGSESGGAMTIFTRNRTSILYGSSSSDWNLVVYSNRTGALPDTAQDIGQVIMFDDRGLTSLAASQAYGNFSSKTLSRNIQQWLVDKRTTVTTACINRDKTQYRLFFSDSYGIYVTFDGHKVIGIMPVLYTNPVSCSWEGETSGGAAVAFFGSTDGMVYQFDKGTSMDGDNIEAYLHVAFNFLRSPRVNKRYRKAVFEVQGDGYAEFTFSYDLGYTSSTIPQPGTTTHVTEFTEVRWDSFTWDNFTWDGQTLSPSEAEMLGTAENVSIKIASDSDYFSPTTFSGVILHYTPRRLLR